MLRMLHYSHTACMCSRVVSDYSCIEVSQLMWVMKRTEHHSTMTLKEIQRSNNAMHVSQINAWRSLYLHIFHSAWTGTLNQPLFNALCSIMHSWMPHVNWSLQYRYMGCRHTVDAVCNIGFFCFLIVILIFILFPAHFTIVNYWYILFIFLIAFFPYLIC